MPRNRSIIIDAALGRAFSNVTGSASASADKVIAGPIPISVTLRQASLKTLVTVASNLGQGAAIARTSGNGLLTNVTCTLAVAPAVSPITVRIKVGAVDYASSQIVGTITIPVNSKSASLSLSRVTVPFDRMYVDVTSALGTSLNKAAGLSVVATVYLSV